MIFDTDSLMRLDELRIKVDGVSNKGYAWAGVYDIQTGEKYTFFEGNNPPDKVKQIVSQTNHSIYVVFKELKCENYKTLENREFIVSGGFENKHEPGPTNDIQYVYVVTHATDKTTGEEFKLKSYWDILDIPEATRELPYVKKLLSMLEAGNKQFVLTGAPGTGKTYVIEQIAETVNSKYSLERKDYFVQFHPSYDYVDFVEGIRPVQMKKNDNLSESEEMSFVKLDGVFKAFCRKVIDEQISDPCIFVIDEVNRADLSKVFGELMYCLEESKRGEDHKISTTYQNLNSYEIESGKVVQIEQDCFKDGFFIPKNVIIIATMNDIDRSVESFDFALRRRFKWIEAGAMGDDYKDYLRKSLKAIIGEKIEAEDKDALLEDCVKHLLKLNKMIAGEDVAEEDVAGKDGREYGLDERYAIGPAYFSGWSGGEAKVGLQTIWDNQIKPLLQEYCRGQKDVGTFLKNCETAFTE